MNLPPLFGNFSIDANKLEDETNRQAFAKLMQGGIVLRAEYLYATDELAYTVWHPAFKRIGAGERIPEYLVLGKHDADGNVHLYFELSPQPKVN